MGHATFTTMNVRATPAMQGIASSQLISGRPHGRLKGGPLIELDRVHERAAGSRTRGRLA
jgi:hypothetical protein